MDAMTFEAEPIKYALLISHDLLVAPVSEKRPRFSIIFLHHESNDFSSLIKNSYKAL